MFNVFQKPNSYPTKIHYQCQHLFYVTEHLIAELGYLYSEDLSFGPILDDAGKLRDSMRAHLNHSNISINEASHIRVCSKEPCFLEQLNDLGIDPKSICTTVSDKCLLTTAHQSP